MKKQGTVWMVVIVLVVLAGTMFFRQTPRQPQPALPENWTVPQFSGEPFVPVNSNVPALTQEEIRKEGFENYSPLDSLGRCGAVIACVGRETMPTEDREGIGQVKPTGWQTVKYDFVDGKYLYNRCHLIGFQLTGENANERNLITGTRYLNMEGMLPFENMIADYVKETGNHVMYRVTPVFEGDDLLAKGVLMEGLSVEDAGEGISFYVFAFNNQPGVTINYATGESVEEAQEETGKMELYVLNTNSRKFHRKDCKLAKDIKESNRQEVESTRQKMVAQGYAPCGSCAP